MAVIIITDEPDAFTTADRPMQTWDGTPLPTGTPLAISTSPDGEDWCEALVEEAWGTEWVEAVPVD